MSDEGVRVLIIGLSKLLREMLEAAFEERPAITVVRAPAQTDVTRAVDSSRADVVIVALERSQLPRQCREWLQERGRVNLLGIQESDGRARMYRLLPDVSELGDVSPETLGEVVESLAPRPAVR